MALSEAEVKKAEEQAELRKRMNQTFLERREQFVRRNRYAVSHFERQGWQQKWARDNQVEDRQALMAHEQKMLEKRNAGALDVAKVNTAPAMFEALGKYGAGGTFRDPVSGEHVAMEKGTELTRTEREFELAQKRLAMEEERGRAQNGYFDKDGNYVGGSDFRKTEQELATRERIAKMQQEEETRRNENEWGYLDENGKFRGGGRSDVAREQGKTQGEAMAAQLGMQKYRVDENNATRRDVVDQQLNSKNVNEQKKGLKTLLEMGRISPEEYEKRMKVLNQGSGAWRK